MNSCKTYCFYSVSKRKRLTEIFIKGFVLTSEKVSPAYCHVSWVQFLKSGFGSQFILRYTKNFSFFFSWNFQILLRNFYIMLIENRLTDWLLLFYWSSHLLIFIFVLSLIFDFSKINYIILLFQNVYDPFESSY